MSVRPRRRKFDPPNLDSSGEHAAQAQTGGPPVWAATVVLVLAGLAAYANSFQADFVFDDTGHIVDSESIHQVWNPRWLTNLAGRPLLRCTLALNYAISGAESTLGYHLFNLAVHLAAGLVLYHLLRETLNTPRLRERCAPNAGWLSLAAALLWVVHPLNTQAVTYIVQRCEAMMGLAFLSFLYCLARSARAPQAWPWQIGALAAFVLGLMSKEVMVAALPVGLLYDRVFLARGFGEMLRRRGWLYGATVVLLVRFAFAVTPVVTSANRYGVGFRQESLTPVQYALSQPGVILHYLQLAVFPGELCFDYEWPAARSATAIAPPLLLVAGLLAASLWALWKHPPIGFAGLSFFLILAPTSSIFPIRDLAVEHRMYLPLVCVIVLGVFAAWRGALWIFAAGDVPLRRQRRLLAGSVAALCLVLIARTALRNYDYRSQASIWRTVVQARPQNARANHNLAVFLEQAGRAEEALAQLGSSIEQCEQRGRPADDLHLTLGELLARQQRWEGAEIHLRQALKLVDDATDFSPPQRERVANARVSLATVLDARGRTDEAIGQYRRAIELRPENALPYGMLGQTLARAGRLAEAVECWSQAAQLEPQWFEVHCDLARALLETGDPQAAVEHLEAAHRLRPGDIVVGLELARQSIRGEHASASSLRRAAEIADAVCRRTGYRDAAALDVLGDALARLGRRREALAAIDRAIVVAPVSQDDFLRQLRSKRSRYAAEDYVVEP